MLQAFDAGAPPLLACQYVGIRFEVWLAECRRSPEFELVAEARVAARRHPRLAAIRRSLGT